MFGLLAAGTVTCAAAYLIAKKVYATAVLLFAGMTLMTIGVIFGWGNFLSAKQSTGFIPFDLFDVVRRMFSTRVGGLGITIMAVAGFSRYMEHMRASDALFAVVAAPLHHIRNPYVLLMATYVVAQFLSIFIPSAAGIALLLTVTVYPILIRMGVSRLSALAIIASARALDMGPASANAIFGAQILKMDVAAYFLQYQLKLAFPLMVIMGVAHFFTQRWWDKREGPDLDALEELKKHNIENPEPPSRWLALLPVLPFCLILGTSPLLTKYYLSFTIKLDVGTAMFLSIIVAVLVEFARSRSFTHTLNSMRGVFEQMGKCFAVVMALIIAGEIFARGLETVGAVKMLTRIAIDAGLSPKLMTFIFGYIIFGAGALMGSGNSAFFSFAPLVPEFASSLNIPGITMMLPMDMMSTIGRTISPIAGATVSCASLVGISPFLVAKREIFPMLVLSFACPLFAFWFWF